MKKQLLPFVAILLVSGCTLKDGNFVFEQSNKTPATSNKAASSSVVSQPAPKANSSTPKAVVPVKVVQTSTPQKATAKNLPQVTTYTAAPSKQVVAITPPVKIEQGESVDDGETVAYAYQASEWPATPKKPMTPPPPCSFMKLLKVVMPEAQDETKLVWHFDPYQKINIQGDLDIQIVQATDGRDTLTITGDPGALLKSGAKNGVLNLQFVTYAHYPKAVLAVPNLQSLTIMGFGNLHAIKIPASLRELNLWSCGDIRLHGDNSRIQKLLINRVKSVDIDGLRTDNLLMWVRQSGTVNLHGIVGLRELDTAETGDINIYWINSPLLTVRINRHTHLFLAGVSDTMAAYLQDQSKLDAKYLRTQTGFIETSGNSEAAVTVLDSLNALAAGNSNIYYYQQPRLVGKYYRDNGSILYMGDTIPPCTTPMCQAMPNPLPG